MIAAAERISLINKDPLPVNQHKAGIRLRLVFNAIPFQQ
jgi:hypothetical protein